MNVMQPIPAETANAADPQAEISARLERLPITREVFWARNIVGAATFFDGYTVIAIAYAMPVLVREWGLSPSQTGMILSMGYLGQLIGAILFGWLAEKVGRLKVLLFTILLFVSMDVACLFAAGAGMMMAFRFVQGIGTGGEVPVASAYINELIGSKGRGKFFLLYEVMFLLGLVGAGLIGYFMVPVYGWKAMFVVGLVPAILMIPLRWFLKESPRWLAANGRYGEANAIVTRMEESARAAGKELPEPKLIQAPVRRTSDWRELFQGVYLKRTLSIWAMWFTAYTVANGTITWLPTLYRQVFNLPLQTSIFYGFLTSVGGVIAAVICALLIDKVGRKRWYTGALLLAPVPLLFSRKWWNDEIGRWLLGYPALQGTLSYRRAHMAHHRDEMGPEEPDAGLYAGYPIPTDSLRRKLTRDLLFISGWKNLRALGYAVAKKEPSPGRTEARQVVGVQVVLFAAAVAWGRPLLYPVCWLAPWMSLWKVSNRLRAIAEHGGMTRSDDRRETTHHVRQRRLARFLIVPYNTGWHLAHHVDIAVPFRNLPAFHAELVRSGWVVPDLEYPSYWALWRKLASGERRARVEQAARPAAVGSGSSFIPG